MAEDIEHLKKHKIEQPRKLPVLQDSPEPTTVEEAVAGSGDKPSQPVDTDLLRERIVDTLKRIRDPEIPVNIYDLGLIYGFEVGTDGEVDIEMTLTAPACPVAGMIVQEVADRVGELDGVSQARVQLTWDPPWSQDRMTEEARLELGLL